MVTCHDFTTVERSVVERAIGEKRDGSLLPSKAEASGGAQGSKAAWPGPYRSTRMIGRRLRLAGQLLLLDDR